MTEQLAIVGTSSPPAPKPLTLNQQLAFDYIRERDGVTVDEIGAWLHAHRDRRPHSVDVRCEWCAKTGQQTVTSVALKPLVTFRRAAGGRLYIARNRADRIRASKPVREPTEEELALNPFAGLEIQ